jgi:hypothetical protein
MVRLGYIKDAEQCPPDFHKVFFRPSEIFTSGRLETTVYSKPDRAGLQRFELAVDAPRDAERLDQWVVALAEVLQGMGWVQWQLDSFSLSMVLDRYITEALKMWGAKFWAVYRAESTVLIQVGLQREAVGMAVNAWREKFKHVQYDVESDFDKLAREEVVQSQERSKKIKSFFTPKFLAPKSK